jgi:hypothetical protein
MAFIPKTREEVIKAFKMGETPRFVAEQSLISLGVPSRFIPQMLEVKAPAPVSAPAALPVPDVEPIKPITSADLRPIKPTIIPTVPRLEPPADITEIEIPELKPTPAETKQIEMEKRLQKLMERLAEKPAFEAEKRKEFEIEAAQKAVEDLQTRIRDLQRQQKLVPEVLELESLGRGRTAGGVRPLEIGRRRAIAVETLTTSSLLDAAQGRLTSARRKVEQAVNERFAPIEAEINALRANLGIIISSPETKLQERKRAEERNRALAAEQARIAEIKAEQKKILEWANKATAELAEQGKLTPQMLTKIDEITEAPTETQAAQLYSDLVRETGIIALEVPALTGLAREMQDLIKIGKLPSDTTLDEYLEIKDPTRKLDIKLKEASLQKAYRDLARPMGALTPTQLFDRELKLAKDFEGYAKDTREANRQIRIIRQSFEEAKEKMRKGESINAASQGVLVSFQKLLDPTSVVRESEYARSPQGLSLIDRIEGLYTKLKQGGAGLTPQALKQFVDLGEKFLKGYQNDQLNFARRTKAQAESIGADLTRVLTPDVIRLLEDLPQNIDDESNLSDEEAYQLYLKAIKK